MLQYAALVDWEAVGVECSLTEITYRQTDTQLANFTVTAKAKGSIYPSACACSKHTYSSSKHSAGLPLYCQSVSYRF
jgi:hypothetical protein